MNPLVRDAVLASLHHLFVFSLVAVLFAELVLASGPPEPLRLAQLGRLDRAYGGLAGGVLAAGFLRAVFGAKGWSYYAGNPIFWTKLSVFAAVGLLSIVPTVRFIRWRKQAVPPGVAAWQATRRWIVVQLALIAAIPVLAVLMARGIGY